MSSLSRDTGLGTDARVRDMRPADLPFAAGLHARDLSHGLFGGLGIRFLREYYRAFVDSPFAVALVCERDGECAGMLVGTTHNGRHYQWVVPARGRRLAVLGIRGLLGHPRQLLRFLHTRIRRYVRAIGRRLRAGPPEPGPADQGHVAVLTHMAVGSTHRGQGLGGVLAEAFLEHARDTRADFAQLVTLGTPQGAAGFYERLGWQLDHQRGDWDGRPVCVFRHEL